MQENLELMISVKDQFEGCRGGRQCDFNEQGKRLARRDNNMEEGCL